MTLILRQIDKPASNACSTTSEWLVFVVPAFRERPAYLNDCKKNGLAVLGGFALQMRMSFLPDNETKRRLAMTILKNNRIS